MAGGAAAPTGSSANAYTHLIDPSRKWYNNRRCVLSSLFLNYRKINDNAFRLIVLNAWITLLLITSSTNGYDGSMMNGLQSLTLWENYFNHPHGGRLGLFNAIQVSFLMYTRSSSLNSTSRTSALSLGTPSRPTCLTASGVGVPCSSARS